MSHLRHLRAITPSERRLLFTAWPLLVLVRLALWFVPFRTLHRRWTTLLPRVARVPASDGLPPARIAWLVAVASRYVPLAHCLTRAVTAQYFLARAGYEAELRIGVRKDGRALNAHAWLEQDGVPLFEDDAHLQDYTPFGRVIAPPSHLVDSIK